MQNITFLTYKVKYSLKEYINKMMVILAYIMILKPDCGMLVTME